MTFAGATVGTFITLLLRQLAYNARLIDLLLAALNWLAPLFLDSSSMAQINLAAILHGRVKN
jgi:hypothetical protein